MSNRISFGDTTLAVEDDDNPFDERPSPRQRDRERREREAAEREARRAAAVNVVNALSAIVVMAELGEAEVTDVNLEWVAQGGYRHPCRVHVRVGCDSFPDFGGLAAKSLEDERGFAERMRDHWVARVEKIAADIKQRDAEVAAAKEPLV